MNNTGIALKKFYKVPRGQELPFVGRFLKAVGHSEGVIHFRASNGKLVSLYNAAGVPMKFICLRCGLPVVPWGKGWKHCANVHTKSCGKPPKVAEKTTYENEIASVVASVVRTKP